MDTFAKKYGLNRKGYMYIPRRKEHTTMKDPKKMTYRELEAELIKNRCALRTSKDLDSKRELTNRDHDLMVEMNSRWNQGGKNND